MKPVLFRLMPLCCILGLGFIFWRGLALDPRDLPSMLMDKPLPSFSLPLLNQEKDFLTRDSLQGQVSLLNIFASWCTSCAEEQDFLLQLAKKGVPIYGISYKDVPSNANQWLLAYGNPYTKIALDKEGLTAIDLGVYGTPETFLIDKRGRVRFRYAGVLNEQVWQEVFLPKWQALEKSA